MKKRDFPDWLLKIGQKRSAAKGETLFLEGEHATGFYALLQGEVRGYKAESSGKEIEVARFFPGDLFGEVVAFAGRDYPITTEVTSAARMLFFDCREISQAVNRGSGAANFFLSLLAGKCLDLTRRLERLALGTVRERLAAHLLKACSGGSACSITIQGSKTQLARQLGTISETLSRNLRKLQDEGIIEVKKESIRVLDCARLRAEIG